MSAELAICAIFRDEQPYLIEWLRFHREQGVERFILFDHQSQDDGPLLLQPYVDEGLVTLIPVEGEAPQMPAYAYALQRFAAVAKWMAFIDIDEFLFSPAGLTLPQVLAEYTHFPAVGVNWCVFGHAGHEIPQPSVLDAYRFRARDDHPLHAHIKSIVQPFRTVHQVPSDPHSFTYTGGERARNECGHPIDGPFSQPTSFYLLRVNHYWSRSRLEAEAKAQKPRADCNQPRTPADVLCAPEFSAIYDDAIDTCRYR